MAFSAVSVVRGPGELAAMVVEVTKRIFTTPFQFREFLEQAWFITSVTLMPTILVSIPFGAVISLQVGNLTGQLGAQSFAGATAVLAVTREAAPIAAAMIIAGAAGSAICSDMGARKIREEIDAMEVLGVDPLARLIAPRVVASAFVAVIPLYIVALCASYLSPRLITTLIYGQSSGTYDHYFLQFLPPVDMLWSFGKLIFLAVSIILIHCYYGYTASGGPAGVGMAVGRAIRTSIVTVVVADFFLSFAIWGSTTTVRITG